MNNKKYTKIVLLSSLLAATVLQVQAQNKLGTNPTNINTNAIFELESSNKGMLMPRLALTATNSASPLTAFTAGMVVYNTATAGTGTTAVTPGYYYCDGSKWVQMADAAARNTPFNLQGTTTDIGGNKDTIAWRKGAVAIGNGLSTTVPTTNNGGRTLYIFTPYKNIISTSHTGVEVSASLLAGEDITSNNIGVNVQSSPAATVGGNNLGVTANASPTANVTSINAAGQFTASPTSSIGTNNFGVNVTASPTGSAAINYGVNITTSGSASLSGSNRSISITNSYGGTTPNVYGISMANNLAATANISSGNYGINNTVNPVSGSTVALNYGYNSNVNPAGTVTSDNLGMQVSANPTGQIGFRNFAIRANANPTAGSISSSNYGFYGTANPSGSVTLGGSNYAGLFQANPTTSSTLPFSNFGLSVDASPTSTLSGNNFGVSISAKPGTAGGNLGINLTTNSDSSTISGTHSAMNLNNSVTNSTLGGYRGIYMTTSPKNTTVNTDYYGFYGLTGLDTNSVANVTQYGIWVNNSHRLGSIINGDSYSARIFTGTSGTVNGNMYALYLDGPGTTGTVTGRRYGILQVGTTALNSLFGNLQVGGATSDSAISRLTVISTGDVTNGVTIVNTLGDAVQKQGMIKTLQYNSAEPPLMGMHMSSGTTGNFVNIGGVTSGHTSPNFIRFYTDADGLTSTTASNLAMSIAGTDVGIGLTNPTERLDVRGKLRIDGSNMIIGFDSLRYATNGLRITGRAGTDLQAALTLMPSGTASRSNLRMYNGSDPANVGWSELSTSDSTLTIAGNRSGVGQRTTTLFVNAMNVGIGTATPQAALHVAGTGAMIIPVGATTSRPSTPVQGMIRYNTTLSKFEGYDGTDWVLLN